MRSLVLMILALFILPLSSASSSLDPTEVGTSSGKVTSYTVDANSGQVTRFDVTASDDTVTTIHVKTPNQGTSNTVINAHDDNHDVSVVWETGVSPNPNLKYARTITVTWPQ